MILEVWLKEAKFANCLFNFFLQAYFFETPPVNQANKSHVTFEFVLVEAKELANVTPDVHTFESHFKNKDKNNIVAFPNLGNNALLVGKSH